MTQDELKMFNYAIEGCERLQKQVEAMADSLRQTVGPDHGLTVEWGEVAERIGTIRKLIQKGIESP